MDPEQALRDARSACQRYNAACKNPGDTNRRELAAANLVDAFEALDGWLSKGGFLPKAWNTEAVKDGQFVDQG